MQAVGVKALKNRLSEFIRLAASGETVLVTDRDRVVAELGPPRPHTSPLLADALLADAVRRGLITPPTFASAEPPPRIPLRGTRLSKLLRELDADRAER
ncbi:MAG: prevent-host-death protein [Thermoanaerobaculia bacterium]